MKPCAERHLQGPPHAGNQTLLPLPIPPSTEPGSAFTLMGACAGFRAGEGKMLACGPQASCWAPSLPIWAGCTQSLC